MPGNYFAQMIKCLRQQEEIILYGNILVVNEAEVEDVNDFLKKEYSREILSYPYTAPEYHPDAALWAAKTVYIAAQLMLYRENKESDLEMLLPDFPGDSNEGDILSADLCLRFLPDMLIQLKLIDSSDPLIEVLEAKLSQWHYSGIKYQLNVDELSMNNIFSAPCLRQLYINRIIDYKRIPLAMHAPCKKWVLANIGDYGNEYWNEFKLETLINDQP